MRVNSIQNNINFNGKLNVLGKFFVREELEKLTAKADKIGYENDVIELSFSNYRDNSIEFLGAKKSEYSSRMFSTLKARFIPNGEGIGTEMYKENIPADSYNELWTKEYGFSTGYLDRLVKKYPNERIGVSIIEN